MKNVNAWADDKDAFPSRHRITELNMLSSPGSRTLRAFAKKDKCIGAVNVSKVQACIFRSVVSSMASVYPFTGDSVSCFFKHQRMFSHRWMGAIV